MKVSDLFEGLKPPHDNCGLSNEDTQRLLAFIGIVIEKLRLDPKRVSVGTVGQMFSKKHGNVKCQANFSAYFLHPPSAFIIKMTPKLLSVLVEKHLPGWKFIGANVYHKQSPVGHYDIEDYMQIIAPTLKGDQIPADSELGVYLKAPKEYQINRPKRRQPK